MSGFFPLPETPALETERLILRPLRIADAPAIQLGFNDWEVVRHLHAGIPWPYPEDGALTNTRECLAIRERGERFFWVLTLKGSSDEAIGRIDLWPHYDDHRDMRGFWLTRGYWGRGLMTEAAEQVTAYAFEDLGWPHIYLTNAAANLGSRRIKEKQGATLVDEAPGEYIGGPGVRQTWRLDRDVWMSRH